MSKITLNAEGEAHARCLIRAGKVNDGPWGFDGGDRAKLLGPKGNHIEEYSRHHLGVEEEEEQEEEGRDLDSGSGGGSVPTKLEHEKYKHPIAKDGEVYTRALKSCRSAAVRAGSGDIYTAANGLLEEIKGQDERGERQQKSEREVRCLMSGVQLRAAADGKGPGTCHGYAAVFDAFSEDLGYFREKVAKGAFAECLDQDVRALVNHNPDRLLGRSKTGSLRMTEDDLGLRVEIDLPDTQVGRDVATEIRSGLLDGMSFSFDTEADSWDRATTPPTRTLLKCSRVYDVGPVAFPAYESTTAAMRSLERSEAVPVRVPEPDPITISLSLSLAQARLRLAEACFPI
jgi:HK97 family phage prohead protease